MRGNLSMNANGSMSEWLGTGLQNRSQRFESAWNLQKPIEFVR